MQADIADVLAGVSRVGPPNVHSIRGEGRDVVDRIAEVTGPAGIVLRVFHVHRPITKRELLLGLYQLLEVPYFGPSPDWDRLTPGWDGFDDVIGDLEWFAGANEHGFVLVVTLQGPPDLQTDALVSQLQLSWRQEADEVWNPKVGVPYHLVLVEQG